MDPSDIDNSLGVFVSLANLAGSGDIKYRGVSSATDLEAIGRINHAVAMNPGNVNQGIRRSRSISYLPSSLNASNRYVGMSLYRHRARLACALNSSDTDRYTYTSITNLACGLDPCDRDVGLGGNSFLTKSLQ